MGCGGGVCDIKLDEVLAKTRGKATSMFSVTTGDGKPVTPLGPVSSDAMLTPSEIEAEEAMTQTIVAAPVQQTQPVSFKKARGNSANAMNAVKQRVKGLQPMTGVIRGIGPAGAIVEITRGLVVGMMPVQAQIGADQTFTVTNLPVGMYTVTLKDTNGTALAIQKVRISILQKEAIVNFVEG